MSDTPPSLRCPNCSAEVPLPAYGPPRGRWRRWWTPLGVASVLILGVVGLAYRYRGQIQTVIQVVNEGTGSTALSVAALAIAGFIAVCLLCWLMLPALVAVAYLDLRCRIGSGPSHPGCGQPREPLTPPSPRHPPGPPPTSPSAAAGS